MEEKITAIMENINYLYGKDTDILDLMDRMTGLINAQQQFIEQLQLRVSRLEAIIGNEKR